MRALSAAVVCLVALACSSPPSRLDGGEPADDGPTAVDGGPTDGGPTDAAAADSAATDAARADADTLDAGACSVDGIAGECVDVSVCAARTGESAIAGYCPGPANIQCCRPTPSVSDNPPPPAGYRIMMQSEVTPAMTNWAVSILNDRADYPMFSTTTMVFGTMTVLARVEWHPPDFQNGAVHRGVTLYTPI